MSTTELPLAAELADLAARTSPLVLSGETVTAAVEELTALAQEVVGGGVAVGVTLVDAAGRPTSSAATAAVVLAADEAQYRLDEGPCLVAAAERRPVRVDDTRREDRWPRWAAEAAALGVASALSTPLLATGRSLGAVKVYSPRRAAFDRRTSALLGGFAGTAALLLANVAAQEEGHGLSAQLRRAVRQRDVVQLATGIVMQRDGTTEAQAFAALVAAAAARRRPLPEVAAALVESAGRPPS